MTEVMNLKYTRYKLQFNFKNPKTIDLKMHERRYRNDQKAQEMLPTSPVTREMQIQTIVPCHCTPTRRAKVTETEHAKC